METMRIYSSTVGTAWVVSAALALVACVDAAAGGGNVHVVFVQGKLGAYEAESICARLGGSLARYVVAPVQMRDLARFYGGARVAKDSYVDKADLWGDQSAQKVANCKDSVG